MSSQLGRILIGLSILAGATGQQPALPTVEVRCVDAADQPVAAAEVHVFVYQHTPRGGQYVARGPFRTGTDGRVVTVPVTTFDGGKFSRLVYATVPGKLVGAQRVGSFSGAAAEAPMTIRMERSRELRGTVQVPDGIDPTTVNVRTLGLSGMSAENPWAMMFPRQWSFASLRDCLPERFDARVAADGSFVLRDLPARPLIYLAADGPGLAHAQWCNALREGRSLPEQITMTMRTETILRGVVTSPDRIPCAGAAVEVKLLAAEGLGVQVDFDVTTDATGRFEVHGLPAGTLRLRATDPAGVMRPFDLEVAQGRRPEAQRIDLEQGVMVRGRVRDEAGQSVEGANVGAIDPNPWGNRIVLGSARSGPQGQFAMRLPTGAAELYISGLPSGFAYPKPQVVAKLDVQPGGDLLRAVELTVQRTR